MKYSVIANAYEKIENTKKRLEMTDILVKLLKNTPKEGIDKVVFLTLGKIYPDFVSFQKRISEFHLFYPLVNVCIGVRSCFWIPVADEVIVTVDEWRIGDRISTIQYFLFVFQYRTI